MSDEIKKDEERDEERKIEKIQNLKMECRCPVCLTLFNSTTGEIIERGYGYEEDDEESEPEHNNEQQRYHGRFIRED